jgi:S-adenosylmethionine:tRNA ribosyltransferase-isomerase
MHEEAFCIKEAELEKIQRAKREKRKILAVGTTSLRTLESVWQGGAGEGTTSIFIYPGFAFKAVDQLFTNFHTPRSTLLMLVSAFAEEKSLSDKTGRDLIMETYQEAIKEGYRFFSYGDAMLIR